MFIGTQLLVSLQARTSPSLQDELDLHATADNLSSASLYSLRTRYAYAIEA